MTLPRTRALVVDQQMKSQCGASLSLGWMRCCALGRRSEIDFELNNMQVWYAVFWISVGISVLFPFVARKWCIITWGDWGKKGKGSFGYNDHNQEVGMCSMMFWYVRGIEAVSGLAGLRCLKLGAGQYNIGISRAPDALVCF